MFTLKKIALTLSLLITVATWGKKSEKQLERDTVLQELYTDFFTLYNRTEISKEFYAVGEKLCDYGREKNLPEIYYKTQLNMCLYETEHNKPDKAMKRANEMLEEMKAENYNGFSKVYMALGTIYESRGNYRMARYYYEHCVNTVAPDDRTGKMSIYSRLAFLLMLKDPQEARSWNKKSFENIESFPEYRQVYYFLETMISFKENNKRDFNRHYAEYLDFHDKHKSYIDSYGIETLKVASLAMDGKGKEALEVLDTIQSTDLTPIGYLDMRIIIARMIHRDDLALEALLERSEWIDSLNSDMLFNNLNELNAQADVAQAKSIAVKERERMFMVSFAFSIVIMILLVCLIIHYRKSRERLSEKNGQLRSALAMAEEGEKMKSEFVRSVSHEIRTPLNAINGFNELLNRPGSDLLEEERADLLNRIIVNVQAITTIIDEMLHVADRKSNEFHPKADTIYCNQFFPTLLYDFRNRVSSTIYLNYTTKMPNRFQIETNKDGVKTVVEQLITNSVKFTKEGSITMHCELTDDRKYVALSITDTGTGVRKDLQDKIFDGFYKADVFKQGIGLGLAVSKKIARKLGGDLVLDKRYTEGARFVLTLPAA